MNDASMIESKFFGHLKEALNAEIVLGNVTNLFEAKEWLEYTFLAVRIKRNGNYYGVKVD